MLTYSVMPTRFTLGVVVVLFATFIPAFAQDGRELWQDLRPADVAATRVAAASVRTVTPQVGRALRLDRAVVDRVNGAAVIQEGFGNATRPPSLFIWRNCTETRRVIPRMVTDPKNAEDVKKVNADAQGRGGDDPYDALRYGVMAARRAITVHTPKRTPNRFTQGL